MFYLINRRLRQCILGYNINDHKSDITRQTKASKKTHKSGRSDKSGRSLDKKLKSRERFEIEKTAEDMLHRIN